MTKIALLCIGNELRGDDAVALEVGRLAHAAAERGEFAAQWRVFFGADVPENEFGAIRNFAPHFVIVCDSVSGFAEGEVEFLDLRDERSYIFSTHNIPAPVLMSYIRTICERVVFLGVRVLIENMLDVRRGLSSGARRGAALALAKLREFDKIIAEEFAQN